MDFRRGLKTVVLILALGFLLGCVQQTEFQALQGEVRRGLDRNEQQLLALRERVSDLQGRLEAYEGDRDTSRKQMADHLNDFTLLQQEVASIRGQVETWTHKEKGLEEILEAQITLRQELQELQQKVEGVPITKPSPTPPPPPKPPEPVKRPEDLYKEARFHFETGDYPKAREVFQTVLTRQPDSGLADNAQFWIGECYFREGNFKKAILEYEKVVSKYPKSAKIPAALLKQGMAFEKLGDVESARYLYRKITKDHAESDQAKMAKHRLERLP